MQGEPVSKEILYTEPVYKISLDYGHGIKTKSYYTDGRLQPSTEDLQKDKAELIEYARKILKTISSYSVDGVDNALLIPKPKCMEL